MAYNLIFAAVQVNVTVALVRILTTLSFTFQKNGKCIRETFFTFITKNYIQCTTLFNFEHIYVQSWIKMYIVYSFFVLNVREVSRMHLLFFWKWTLKWLIPYILQISVTVSWHKFVFMTQVCLHDTSLSSWQNYPLFKWIDPKRIYRCLESER